MKMKCQGLKTGELNLRIGQGSPMVVCDIYTQTGLLAANN